MNGFQILFCALLLDYIFGDPERVWNRYPHPAVLMGRLVSAFDIRLNKGALRRTKGIITATLLALFGLLLGYLIKLIPDYGIIEMLVATTLLAHKNLIKHVGAVATGLGVSLKEGRAEVAKIVGRETKDLDEANVVTAAVESAAENFSDAVFAPVFWYFILGLPGIIMYKFINTADSMIGHKSEKYQQFGYGAARLDDLLNWVPARLCGGLMCIVKKSYDAWDIMLSDAPLHASPNAGWPEAAMAGILDIRMAGPRVYDGELTNDPYINMRGSSNLSVETIGFALHVLRRTWLAMTAFIGFFAVFTWIFFT